MATEDGTALNDQETITNPGVVESMDEIFETNDVEYDTIEAWGKQVRIVSLNAEDFIEWQEANDTSAKKTAGIRLFIKCIVNSKGQHIGNPKDIEKLKKKSVREILKVVKQILKMNGLETKKADEPTEAENQKNG